MEEEKVLEDNLIQQLIHGESQWTLRDDLKNEDDLWNNFFKILSQNNKSVLKDVPLTENEKAMIKSKVVHPTFYRSAEWLAGANRMVKLPIPRDKSELGIADLTVLDNTNITGGSSVYEVVHQIQFHKRDDMNRNRRTDVTLLINGLPMIHIELKNRNHGINEAFNQIQKYIDEQMFNGIFSTIQMFVVTNGTESKYIAAGQQLRKKFMTNWVDENNKPVHDYLAFARDVLSIPAAHHMIADYVVLDNDQKNIILLRPYQIHAIQAIQRASIGGNPQSGFIWHTTGSGKTLTSYKVAHNLLAIPSVQKTIFLIDRNDLDTQTSSAFKTYAQTDTIEVSDTDNSYDLARKLASPNKQVIVATRQKMQALFKHIKKDKKEAKLYQKIRNMRMTFIVDECHRAVSPDQKNEIDAFFAKKPLWYGFTGTPIFAENARQEKGSNARTTEQQYGPCLHRYTIKDAIRDKAVLGFQVEERASDDVETDNEDDAKKLNQIYLSETHMRQVVKNFFKTAYKKLGIYNKQNRGYTYSALFTTSSIKQAQRYCKLFRKIINGEDEEIKVPERIKKILPDFPRMAITYSIGENGDGDEANQNEMKQSLEDYNKLFGTHYSMDLLKAYNTNVTERLARKKKQYQARDQQLDFVIVVDRLLTGFDAPSLSTLYIDRHPMPYKDLIQAFSRTNRIFDKDKKYGQIITFQYPKKYKEDIDNALALYSEGGNSEILAPDWKTSKARFEKAEHKIIKYKNNSGISILDAPDEDQKQFLKEYQHFDKAYGALQTYSEFDQIDVGEKYGLDDNFLEDLRGDYKVIRERFAGKGRDEDVSDIDFDYELEVVDKQTVDYSYIVKLIQSYIPSDGEEESHMTEAEVKEIDEYIKNLATTNPAAANIIMKLWNKIKADPEKFRNKQVNEILQSMIDDAKNNLLKEFTKEYKVQLDALKYVMRHYNLEKDEFDQLGMQDLLAKESFLEYRKDHQIIPLKWKKMIRKAVRELYRDQISPLIHLS